MRRPNRLERGATASATRDRSLAALALAATLSSCATCAPEPPPVPDAPAVACWYWTPIGEEFEGDPDSIWEWNLRVDVPGDDLEFDLRFRSDPKLVEGSWIDDSAS